MREMLFDLGAANGASLSPVTITEVRARPVATEELVLNVDREIACPPLSSNEVLIGGYRTVDQHLRRRRVAVLIDQPPPKIEQHDRKVLVDNPCSAEPVDQEGTVLDACQNSL